MAEKANSFLDQLKENTKSDDTVERLDKEVADFYEIIAEEWATIALQNIKEVAMAKAKSGDFEEINGKKVINSTCGLRFFPMKKSDKLLADLNKKLFESKMNMIEKRFARSANAGHKNLRKHLFYTTHEQYFVFSTTVLGSHLFSALKRKANAEKIQLTNITLPFELTGFRYNAFEFSTVLVSSSDFFNGEVKVARVTNHNIFTSKISYVPDVLQILDKSERFGLDTALVEFCVEY